VTARYCLCGAAMQASSTPPSVAESLAAEFIEHHTGEGHGSATRQQAAAVRRREERRLIGEMR
jgi:hypothetical protein